MSVSCGTSHICMNEDKYEPAVTRGLPTDLVEEGQARDMKHFHDMKVLERVEQRVYQHIKRFMTVDGQRKTKSPSELGACVVLKDDAVTKLDDLYDPAPTSLTV